MTNSRGQNDRFFRSAGLEAPTADFSKPSHAAAFPSEGAQNSDKPDAIDAKQALVSQRAGVQLLN